MYSRYADGFFSWYCLQWSKLYDPVVWLEAAAQIFFSLGVGFGAHITYTSYTDPNKESNPLKDTVTVAFINCGTSLFASIVIFSILGFKATASHVGVDEVSWFCMDLPSRSLQ